MQMKITIKVLRKKCEKQTVLLADHAAMLRLVKHMHATQAHTSESFPQECTAHERLQFQTNHESALSFTL